MSSINTLFSKVPVNVEFKWRSLTFSKVNKLRAVSLISRSVFFFSGHEKVSIEVDDIEESDDENDAIWNYYTHGTGSVPLVIDDDDDSWVNMP